LPTTLHVSITNKTGACTCLPDSLALIWAGGTTWNNPNDSCASPQFVLICQQVGVWQLTVPTGIPANPSTHTCNPFLLVFNGFPFPSYCLGGTATITITE